MECFKEFKVSIRRNGILQYDSSYGGKIITIALNFFMLGVHVLFVMTTLFSLFWAQPFEDLVENIVFTTASLVCISWYCNFIYQRKHYTAIFSDLDGIVSERIQNPVSNMIYTRTNKNVEIVTKYTRIFGAWMFGPAYAFHAAVKSLYNYVYLNHGCASFQQIYPAAYPFVWQTVDGYVLCILIQTTTICAAGETTLSIFILFVGFCLFMADLGSDLKESLLQLNENQIDKSDTNSTITERIEIMKCFYDIILFHSNARKFVRRFSDINIYLVSPLLLYTLCGVCCLYLEINMALENGNFNNILRDIFMTIVVILFLYVFCHFGDQITQQFNDVQDAVFNMAWYKFPLEMQKNIPMIISLAQKEVYVEAFGNIHCTREIFMKIMKGSFSYFMVLRR